MLNLLRKENVSMCRNQNLNHPTIVEIVERGI